MDQAWNLVGRRKPASGCQAADHGMPLAASGPRGPLRCNAREHALGRVSILFHIRVYVHDSFHDLVRFGVRVSGRIRVRDSARYRCCYHVSVVGRDRDPYGVRVYVDEFVRVCDSACFNRCFHVSVSDLVRDRVSVRVHVQCP